LPLQFIKHKETSIYSEDHRDLITLKIYKNRNLCHNDDFLLTKKLKRKYII